MSKDILQPYAFENHGGAYHSDDVHSILRAAYAHYEAQVRQLGGLARPDAEPAGDPGMSVVGLDELQTMVWRRDRADLVRQRDAQAAIASEREHASKLRETLLRMQSEHAAAIAARDERIARLESAMASSCDEERQQLWEAGPGGTGCKRAGAAEARVRELEAALLACARKAEALKQPCSMDPESAQAIEAQLWSLGEKA